MTVQGPENSPRPHLNRWLTGIVALPVVVLIIALGPRWLFCLLLLTASVLGQREFYRMVSSTPPLLMRWMSYLITIGIFVALFMRQVLMVPGLILLWVIVPMIIDLFTFTGPKVQGTENIAKVTLGSLYGALPILILVLMDGYPHGRVWVLFLLTVIFAGDTGAFYSGRLFGRHKLYPAVSPKKTWEGALGGFLGSLFTGAIFLKIFPIHPVNVRSLMLMGLLSVIGQVGDLAQSVIKRNCGVKDSGHLLPGHGGLLDRIDGLLFGIPLMYLYLQTIL